MRIGFAGLKENRSLFEAIIEFDNQVNHDAYGLDCPQ
jgi:hypothetical protein